MTEHDLHLIEIGEKHGAEKERAAIVAWIMDKKDEIIDWFPRDIAGAITDGKRR